MTLSESTNHTHHVCIGDECLALHEPISNIDSEKISLAASILRSRMEMIIRELLDDNKSLRRQVIDLTFITVKLAAEIEEFKAQFAESEAKDKTKTYDEPQEAAQ